MADSETAICNMALMRLGQKPILSLTDGSNQALTCATFYEATRDSVLAAFPWGFAMARTSLAADGDAPSFEFDVAYSLPADVINVSEVDFDPDDYPWRVEGGKILTDAPAPIYITYTSRVTDTTKFDPLFVDALAEYLAADIAFPITRKDTLRRTHLAVAEAKLAIARSRDSQQGSQQEFEANDLIEVR